MKKFFLVTVDCDLRCDSIDLRQKSLNTLLEVFAEHGMRGHATWFLNENDFSITINHGLFLKKVLGQGDSIGVHDHYDGPAKNVEGKYDKNAVKEFCFFSKKKIEDWLKQNNYADKKLIFHRNGCLVQSSQVYTALKELGYCMLFDICPERTLPDRKGFLSFDNRSIPRGILPYRHDTANFLDYRSKKGYFLHIPVTQLMMCLDFTWITSWIETFEKKSVETGVITWAFHPYEILDKDRKEVSSKKVELLHKYFEICRQEYDFVFTNAEECIKELSLEEIEDAKISH